MKTSLITSAVALVALTIALACQSCITTKVTETLPDGTVRVTETKAPATDTINTVSGAVVEVAQVRGEK